MIINELVGHTLLEISLDGDSIKLKTDKCSATITAEGDCCSSGWVADLVSVPLPSKIVEYDDRCDAFGLASDDPRFSEGYVVVAYGAKIVTENGPVTFNVWNDSNGYYGSSVHFSAQY